MTAIAKTATTTRTAAELLTTTALADTAFLTRTPSKAEDALTIALRVIADQQRRIVELENESQTDPLTALLNKRGFVTALERERDRALRTGKASAILVLFDLDGLKQVNDTHGHLAGDAYINGMATALKDTVRSTDYIARIGGDEFALLLTDVDVQKGWSRVNTIVERLNSHTVRHSGGRVMLKVSHGATPVMPGESAEALINQADSKLYVQKATRKMLQATEGNAKH